jgi:hypothetical protein
MHMQHVGCRCNHDARATVAAQVLEYVTQKAVAYQLQRDLSNYERKVEISEMELKRCRTQVRTRGATGHSSVPSTAKGL